MERLADTRKFALKEDDLKMTKDDIDSMIEGLIIRSRKSNITKWGILYRTTLTGFKGFMKIMPAKTLEMIWSDILRFFNLLLIRNQMEKEKQDLGDRSPLEVTFAKLKDDIKKGNW